MDILVENPVDDSVDSKRKISGVRTVSGNTYPSRAVILCTGVYLDSRCIYGEVSVPSGPSGLPRSTHLSDSLRELGLPVRRFKTGTPARIAKSSIDFSKMEVQKGDDNIVPQIYIYLKETHEAHQL